jgi:histone-lysine N-methyltransferase SETMAR
MTHVTKTTANYAGVIAIIRGWSEKFSASTIEGNTIGKIFFFQVGTSVISISFYQVVCFIQLSKAGVLSVSLKMDKYRAVIKFFVKEGVTPNEIHSKFIKVYGDSSPSFSTITKWAAEFKRGRTSLEDDPREGLPKSATTPDIIEQEHNMVLDDRRMKVREIAVTIGISKERVGDILHEELDMNKLCARWVPRLLTADQKTHSHEKL